MIHDNPFTILFDNNIWQPWQRVCQVFHPALTVALGS